MDGALGVPTLTIKAKTPNDELEVEWWGNPRQASPRFLAAAAFAQVARSGALTEESRAALSAALRVRVGTSAIMSPISAEIATACAEYVEELAAERQQHDVWLLAYSYTTIDEGPVLRVLYRDESGRFPAVALVRYLMVNDDPLNEMQLMDLPQETQQFVQNTLQEYPM